jgi:ABC-type transport system involved in multi-copper enzyme maturation permease subunit
MLSAPEVGLTAQREVRRNLESTKGIVMFVLFFLGGLIPRLGQLAGERLTVIMSGDAPLPEDAKRAAFHAVFTKFLAAAYSDQATQNHLGRSPSSLYYLFWGTVAFVPFFILLIGFDQIAGEAQHRTLRYVVGRAFRGSVVLGKALGVWAVIAIMILVLHLTVWILLFVEGSTPAGAILGWGAYFWFLSVVSSAAYVGFASLMSSLTRTPVVSLFLGLGVSLGIYMAYGILNLIEGVAKLKMADSAAHSAHAATWAFPYAYDKLVVSPNPGQAILGAGLYLAWGALAVAGASIVVTRRDL